jgi:hypothetical protein
VNACASVCLSVCLSVSLHMRALLSVCLSVCLPVYFLANVCALAECTRSSAAASICASHSVHKQMVFAVLT